MLASDDRSCLKKLFGRAMVAVQRHRMSLHPEVIAIRRRGCNEVDSLAIHEEVSNVRTMTVSKVTVDKEQWGLLQRSDLDLELEPAKAIEKRHVNHNP
jgi:hypothetical protein